jgi:hypothetical protein
MDNFAVWEDPTEDQRAQQRDSIDELPDGQATSDWPPDDMAGRAPYPTRVRVFLLLSLASWALVIAAILLLRR